MRSLALLAVLVLSGCAISDDRAPAVLELPINRFESPEPVGGALSFGFSGSEESYLILSKDQSQSAPDSRRPEVGRCPASGNSSGDLFFDRDDEECAAPVVFKAGVAIAPAFELGMRHTANGFTYPQAKLYLSQPKAGRPRKGDISLALTAAYGKDDPSFRASDSNGSYVTDFDRRMSDFALIAGQRLNPRALLFGGPYYSEHRYTAAHTRSSGSSTVRSTVQGEAAVRGLNMGLRFDLNRSGKSTLITECARASVKAGETREYLTRCAAGMEFSFGLRPR